LLGQHAPVLEQFPQPISDLERVRRLHEPGVGSRPPGEPCILRTLEQDHDHSRERVPVITQRLGEREGARARSDLVGDDHLGTFALIFFGAGTIIATGNTDQLAIALAHGLTIAIMVSLMVHISGAVFNPAIQVALWVTGKMPTVRSAVYIVAQLAGAVAAASL